MPKSVLTQRQIYQSVLRRLRCPVPEPIGIARLSVFLLTTPDLSKPYPGVEWIAEPGYSVRFVTSLHSVGATLRLLEGSSRLIPDFL